MSERAAYSRVYWSIVDDPKFVSIYDDDRHLATWLRLLLIADQAHPSSPALPVGCRKASIAALVEAELIDLGTGNRYRVHGLDAERERRRIAATSRGPNGTPTVTERSPNGIQTPGLRRDEVETRRDETARADFDALDVYHELSGFRPWGQWSGEHLTAAIRDYGNPTVEEVLRSQYAKDGDRNTLLKRVEAQLAKDADRRREAAKTKRPTAIRKSPEEVEAEYRENKRLELMLVNGELP